MSLGNISELTAKELSQDARPLQAAASLCPAHSGSSGAVTRLPERQGHVHSPWPGNCVPDAPHPQQRPFIKSFITAGRQGTEPIPHCLRHWERALTSRQGQAPQSHSTARSLPHVL